MRIHNVVPLVSPCTCRAVTGLSRSRGDSCGREHIVVPNLTNCICVWMYVCVACHNSLSSKEEIAGPAVVTVNDEEGRQDSGEVRWGKLTPALHQKAILGRWQDVLYSRQHSIL